MPYYVSRQSYWPDGELVVEIAGGGLDYANPDMLHDSKGLYCKWEREYQDPKEALKAAISIREVWARVEPDEQIRIECGYTHGWTVPFAEEPTDEQLQEWADEEMKHYPECPWCEEVMWTEERWFHDLSDKKFCSERCAGESFDSFLEPITEGDDHELAMSQYWDNKGVL